ncbi:GNAT family N-acetyltransferase [Pontibaca salina]|uniref:GNAT family N-acetyltransferase n=1 Tax=Pontibaca salina TaxID=2795731 RepID=UPI001E5A849B|nr:GNAT family N-acetyltransferase [Pontibaca salina]
MSEPESIAHERGPDGGRYALRRDGAEAELTYQIASPDLILADHTGVPDAMRHTGAGAALVKRMVEDARAGGYHIRPTCPFVEAMRNRHPDWADAFES